MKSGYLPLGPALAALCLVLTTGCVGGGVPVPGETRTVDGIEFQWCPPGTFTMGSPSNEEFRSSDEVQHVVTISRGFWLGKYEVTQAQWEAVMDSNPSKFDGDERPVELVSWNDAQEFIDALNGAKGVAAPYRLPTESEWEYACRAGTTARFYWGDDPSDDDIDDYAWYGSNSGLASHDVGTKLPNAWGLHDMSGNVYEWCQDWYGAYPAGPVTNPQGPGSGGTRTFRGGGWSLPARTCRSAGRHSTEPDRELADLGFRLLLTNIPN
jgi:formylglycine-generating enzyme required for sulfatase activity